MGTYYNKVVNIETRWTDIVAAMRESGIWHEHLTALDIGCAEGEITAKIAEFCTRVKAFDIEPYKIFNCPILDNVEFFIDNIKTFDIKEFAYEIIFYLGIHHKLQSPVQNKILQKLFTTKAIIILRAPIEYAGTFIDESFAVNRNILFYPGNKGQGPVSISCLN